TGTFCPPAALTRPGALPNSAGTFLPSSLHSSLGPTMIEFLAPHFSFVGDPTAWVALITLIVLEVVLGIDNLIFISILTNKLPADRQVMARRLGIGAALVMRLV